MLAGTAQFKAPQDIEAQVLERHRARSASALVAAARPGMAACWRRSLLLLTGVTAAAALVLGRPATPAKLHAVISHPVAVLEQPAADLHATMNVLAVFHRLTDTVAGSLPDDVWYGGIALCAVAYVALVFPDRHSATGCCRRRRPPANQTELP